MLPEAEVDDDKWWPGPHRMAEHFVDGLRDMSKEGSRLPTTWSETKPVRLGKARTILLAAMTRFSDDPQGALSSIRDFGGTAQRRAVVQ